MSDSDMAHLLADPQQADRAAFDGSTSDQPTLPPQIAASPPQRVRVGLQRPFALLDLEHFELVARLDVVGVGQHARRIRGPRGLRRRRP